MNNFNEYGMPSGSDWSVKTEGEYHKEYCKRKAKQEPSPKKRKVTSKEDCVMRLRDLEKQLMKCGEDHMVGPMVGRPMNSVDRKVYKGYLDAIIGIRRTIGDVESLPLVTKIISSRAAKFDESSRMTVEPQYLVSWDQVDMDDSWIPMSEVSDDDPVSKAYWKTLGIEFIRDDDQ